MTLKLIHWKARELRNTTRRQLLGTLGGPFAVLLLYMIGSRVFPALDQSLHVLFACALTWSVLGLWFVNRGMWTAAMPDDVGLRTGLDFCREEIARRRRLSQRALVWSFGPVILTLATFILALVTTVGPRGMFPQALPFLLLVLVWVIGYCVVRYREQRGLERELDELNALERESSR